MPKTANINLRVDPNIKAEANAVFSALGISTADAINIFLHTAILEGGFPFQPKMPKYNYETMAAFQEARDIMEGKIEAKSYNSLSEILDEINAEDEDA